MSNLVINIAAEYRLCSKPLIAIFEKAFDPTLTLCKVSGSNYEHYQIWGGSSPFWFSTSLIDAHQRKYGFGGKLWDIGERLDSNDQFVSFYGSKPHKKLCKMIEKAGPYKCVEVCFTEAQISSFHANRPNGCRPLLADYFLANALLEEGFVVESTGCIIQAPEPAISLRSYRLSDDTHRDLSQKQVDRVYRNILNLCRDRYDEINQTQQAQKARADARAAKQAKEDAEYRRRYLRGSTHSRGAHNDRDELDWHQLNDWK